MDRRSLLGKMPLFAGLDPAELDRLPTQAQRLRARQALFRFGDAAGRAYVVESGRLKIVRELGEREIVLDVVGAGAVIGELALLDETERLRSASAVAVGPVSLLAIDRRDLIAFLKRHPTVALALCASLAARVRRLDAQLLDATFLGLEPRLARTLLQLAARFGRPSGRDVEIDLAINQKELGQMIGFSRESVNKQLREFARRGIAVMTKNRITIRDAAALRTLCASP